MPDDARPDDARRDDAKLVRAAAGGDEDAFRALVERYAARVAAICYGVTGDAESSRDLAQEVFTEAFVSLRRLRSPGKFGPWLARVARLKAVSWIRHRVRHREERAHSSAEFLAARRGTPGEDAEHREVCERVLAAVRGLPPAYREVIILRCLEEESPKTICRMLGISLAAMDKRLSRAKSMLREALGGLVGEGEGGKGEGGDEDGGDEDSGDKEGGNKEGEGGDRPGEVGEKKGNADADRREGEAELAEYPRARNNR